MPKTQNFKIEAKSRGDEKPQQVRQRGEIPAIVYGGEIKEPKKVAFPANEFTKLYYQAGTSGLVDLEIEDEHFQTLIKDVQFDPVKGDIIHADLQSIESGEKIQAEVALHFEGEAPAVETEDAVLVHSKDTLHIEALPKDLPSHINVDQSVLEEIDDVIKVSDLDDIEGVEILEDENAALVAAKPPREEEEIPETGAMAEEEAIAQVEASEEKAPEELEEGEEIPEEGAPEEESPEEESPEPQPEEPEED